MVGMITVRLRWLVVLWMAANGRGAWGAVR
jgi:hypothetical protein